MKNLIVCIAVMFIKGVVAQNPNTDYRIGIKVYNLARYEESERSMSEGLGSRSSILFKKKTFNLLHPTIAIQWKSKRNNFHEIEIVDLKWENAGSTRELRNDSTNINTKVYGDNVKETSIAARYEFTIVFNKKKERKLVPSLGLAISPYYTSHRLTPELSSSFPEFGYHTGIRTFVTPRITYFIKQKLFIDLNIPVCISQAEFSEERNYDPSISKTERKIFFDAYAFPKMFSVRIGVGIKL